MVITSIVGGHLRMESSRGENFHFSAFCGLTLAVEFNALIYSLAAVDMYGRREQNE